MSRSKVLGYWVSTAWVALGMFSGGIAHVMHVQQSVDGFVTLGYPLHFVTLLGVWKILGAITNPGAAGGMGHRHGLLVATA